MSDNNDGAVATASPEGEGTEASPDQKVTEQADPIALARKRQAGAEAARQKAEEERNNALKELETYRSKERSVEDQSLQDNAKLQERLTAAERRAEEAEAKAQGRILDTLYPNARKELPEVTDEVRLAKFEALLADDDSGSDKEPPTPQNPNESNRAARSDATKKDTEETSEDIKARLKVMTPDWL